jgi:diguanylate cyclase (GGDEF)-like protein
MDESVENGRRPIQAEKRLQASRMSVQRGRALAYSGGVAIAAAARAAGVIELSWSVIVLFLVIGLGSVAVVRTLIGRGVDRVGPLSVQTLWILGDLGLFVLLVAASGGVASPWYPWAVANIAAAAFVAGRRGAYLVMALSLVGYILVVLALDRPDPGALLMVAFRMLILYAAAFFAVQGICDLQERRQQISGLREQERRRTAQLTGLMVTVEERNAQLARLTDELRKVAVTDPLTGLPNRRYLKERIQEDLALLRRTASLSAFNGADATVTAAGTGTGTATGRRTIPALAFVMVDIDGFKEINDQHGHDAGDEVLRQVASIIGQGVRGLDTVIRWGGDEMLVVLREISEQDLMAVVRRLIGSIRRARFELGDLGSVRLTCSVGFCAFPLGSLERPSWEEAVKLADRALRAAREQGGDQVVGVLQGERALDRAGTSILSRDLDGAEREGYVRLETDSHRSGGGAAVQ